MQLSEEQQQRVFDAVNEELVERAWAQLESHMEELMCISVSRLAGMLDLSTSQTRRMLDEAVDFGPQATRVTLAQARRMVESRTVRLRPGGRDRGKGGAWS